MNIYKLEFEINWLDGLTDIIIGIYSTEDKARLAKAKMEKINSKGVYSITTGTMDSMI